MAIPLTPLEVSNPDLAAILLGTPRESEGTGQPMIEIAPGEELSGDGAGESLTDASAESAPDEPEANEADLIASILNLLDESPDPLTDMQIAHKLNASPTEIWHFTHHILREQLVVNPGSSADGTFPTYASRKREPEASTPAAEFAALVTESNRLAAEKIRAEFHQGVESIVRRQSYKAAPNWRARLKELRAKYPDHATPPEYANLPNWTRHYGTSQHLWNNPHTMLHSPEFALLIKSRSVAGVDGFMCVLEGKYKASAGGPARAAYHAALRQQRLAAHDVADLVEKVDRQSRTLCSYEKQLCEQHDRINHLVMRNIGDRSNLIASHNRAAATAQNLFKDLDIVRARRDNWRAKYEALLVSDDLWVTRYNAQLAEIESLKSEIAEMRAAALGVSVEQLPGLTTDHADIIETAAAIS
jgi:hypothetical protein